MKKAMYIKPNVRVMAIDDTELLAATTMPGSVNDDNSDSGDEGDAKHFRFIEDDDEPTSGSRSPWDN